jgi:hypothetical protein
MSVSAVFDPKTIPKAGVFISSNARVYINDPVTAISYEIIRANRAIVRWSNNTGLYLSTGKQTGITYVGQFDISGSFSRAHISFAEARLVVGAVPPLDNPFLDMVKGGSEGQFKTGGRLDLSRYPQRNIVIETELDSEAIDWGPVRIRVHKPLFGNAQMSYEANDLIRSGPNDYIGSYPSFMKIE